MKFKINRGHTKIGPQGRFVDEINILTWSDEIYYVKSYVFHNAPLLVKIAEARRLKKVFLDRTLNED